MALYKYEGQFLVEKYSYISILENFKDEDLKDFEQVIKDLFGKNNKGILEFEDYILLLLKY